MQELRSRLAVTLLSHVGTHVANCGGCVAALDSVAIEELHIAAKWRWVLSAPCLLRLQIVAGEPQMTCYTMLVAGAYSLFSLIARNAEFASAFRHYIDYDGSVRRAVIVDPVASRRVSFCEQGQRIGIPYEYFSGGSLPPRTPRDAHLSVLFRRWNVGALQGSFLGH